MTARLVTWAAQIGGDATVYEAAQQMLEGLYRKAVGEAYRKRHSMRWVTLDSATHGLLAEGMQRLREQTWLDSDDMFQAAVSDPRSERLPDGTAPPLATICGLPVRIDDTIEGIEWDTGPEPDPRLPAPDQQRADWRHARADGSPITLGEVLE